MEQNPVNNQLGQTTPAANTAVVNAAPNPQVTPNVQPQAVQPQVQQPVQVQPQQASPVQQPQVQQNVQATVNVIPPEPVPQTTTITAAAVASQVSNITNASVNTNPAPQVQAANELVPPQTNANPMASQPVNNMQNPYVNPMMMGMNPQMQNPYQQPVMYQIGVPVTPVMYVPMQPQLQAQPQQKRLIGQDVYQVDDETQSIQSYNDMVLRKFYGEDEKMKQKERERKQGDEDNRFTLGKLLGFILAVANLIFAPSFVLKYLSTNELFVDNQKLLIIVYLGYYVISALLVASTAYKIAKCNKVLKIIYFVLLVGYLGGMGFLGFTAYVAISATVDNAKSNTFVMDLKTLIFNAKSQWISEELDPAKIKYSAYANNITCNKKGEVTQSEQTTEEVTPNENTVVETVESSEVSASNTVIPTTKDLSTTAINLTYFVGINSEGVIVDLYATDGTYIIASHNSSGVDLENLTIVETTSDIKEPDSHIRKISDFTGKTSANFTCSYDDNEYIVKVTLQ